MSLLKKGLRFVSDKFVALVLERKKDLDKKTRFYLFDTQSKTYISGLYFVCRVENSGTITEKYVFDYKGVAYLLEYNLDGSYKIVEQSKS